MDKDKVESTSSGSSMKASGGGSRSDSSGPTGSSRHYPKGKSIRSTDWNPMRKAASTYGVNGCGSC